MTGGSWCIWLSIGRQQITSHSSLKQLRVELWIDGLMAQSGYTQTWEAIQWRHVPGSWISNLLPLPNRNSIPRVDLDPSWLQLMIACLSRFGLGISWKLKAMVSMRAWCTKTTKVLFYLRRMAKPPVAREPNISTSGTSLWLTELHRIIWVLSGAPLGIWFLTLW